MENANIGKLKWVILGDFQTFFDDFPTLLREAISPLPIPLSRRMKHIQGLPEMSVTTLKLCTGQSFQYIFLVHIAN